MTNYKGLLEDLETEASTLLAIAIQAFQDPSDEDDITVFRWDPQTLLMELKSEYNADVPEINSAKIQALITALTTDVFYTEPNAFEKICMSICDEGDVVSRNVPDPEEMAWATQQVQWLLSGDTRKDFNEPVSIYAGQVLTNHGIFDPPKILNFANRSEKFNWPSQDTDMFRSLWQRQAEQITKISEYVQEHTSKMLQEMSQIPGMIKSITKEKSPAVV